MFVPIAPGFEVGGGAEQPFSIRFTEEWVFFGGYLKGNRPPAGNRCQSILPSTENKFDFLSLPSRGCAKLVIAAHRKERFC
jgi:hypothetical protein